MFIIIFYVLYSFTHPINQQLLKHIYHKYISEHQQQWKIRLDSILSEG